MTSHNTEHLDRDYIKTLPDQAKADLNADPITGEPGSHPVGTGVGTTAGAIAGAAVGSLGGPVGAAIGGVAGAIAGAAAGHKTGEVIDPTLEAAYWRNELTNRPYYNPSYSYDQDYAPAYRLGYESRRTYPTDVKFDEHENSLQKTWDLTKAESRLTWEQAKQAVRDAWEDIKH